MWEPDARGKNNRAVDRVGVTVRKENVRVRVSACEGARAHRKKDTILNGVTLRRLKSPLSVNHSSHVALRFANARACNLHT